MTLEEERRKEAILNKLNILGVPYKKVNSWALSIEVDGKQVSLVDLSRGKIYTDVADSIVATEDFAVAHYKDRHMSIVYCKESPDVKYIEAPFRMLDVTIVGRPNGTIGSTIVLFGDTETDRFTVLNSRGEEIHLLLTNRTLKNEEDSKIKLRPTGYDSWEIIEQGKHRIRKLALVTATELITMYE